MRNAENSVTNLVVIDSEASTGSLVYWKASPVKTLALSEAWEAAGLPSAWLPAPVTRSAALRKALQDTLAGKRRLVRPHDEEGHFSVIQEGDTGSHLTHACILRASLAPKGPGEETVIIHEGSATDAAQVQAAFVANWEERSVAELGVWLTALIHKRFEGVMVRAGVYFVPRDHVEQLRAVGRLLRGLGTRISEIPAMRMEEAAEAICHAIEEEAGKALAEIEEYLIENTEPGKRGLNAKTSAIKAIRDKIAKYETLFDTKINGPKLRMSTLNQRIAGLMVKTDAIVDGRYLPEMPEVDGMVMRFAGLDLRDTPAPSTPSEEAEGIRKLELD